MEGDRGLRSRKGEAMKEHPAAPRTIPPPTPDAAGAPAQGVDPRHVPPPDPVKVERDAREGTADYQVKMIPPITLGDAIDTRPPADLREGPPDVDLIRRRA